MDTSPPRSKAVMRSPVLRAALPHGLPLVQNAFYFGEYIPEVCRRLEGSPIGGVVVVTGYSDLSGIGKTSLLASVVQEEATQTKFCAMFWMNVGAYVDDADLFGGTKLLAIDVYFNLRNLVESIGGDSGSVAAMNKCGNILPDLDTLESAENAIREMINLTKNFLMKKGYRSCSPLLVLDDLWNQRLLLLFKETGFTILLSTRHSKVLEDGLYAGSCYIMDPLPTETCLRLFFSMSPVDRSAFEKLPSSRDLVRLCSKFISPLELSVLGTLTNHWDPSALLLKLPMVLKKREKILKSREKMEWVDKYWKELPGIFCDVVSHHRSTMTSLLLSLETLDELALKCYVSLVVIPPELAFEFEFIRSLWDLGSDDIVKAILDILESRHCIVKLVQSPPVSSSQRRNAGVKVSSSSEDNPSDSPTAESFEESLFSDSKLQGLYQLHAVHADFLLLCAINFAEENTKAHASSLESIMSVFRSGLDSIMDNWISQTFSPKSLCFLAISQSCDRAARYLASKELLLNTIPSRLFLLNGYWKRLGLLNKLLVWKGYEKVDSNHSCIVPYLQERVHIEVELEGISGAREYMTQACMMLEFDDNEHSLSVLEKWYREILESYGACPSEDSGHLLEQARLLNCLGELLIKYQQPDEALTYHRKALLIYPHFINVSIDAGREVQIKKQIAEKGMLKAMENVAIAITLLSRTDRNFDVHALSEATETQQLVVRMKTNMYGNSNVESAMSMSRLAEMLYNEGKYNEAIVHHEKVLKIFAEKIGVSHALYQKSRGEYGISLLRVAGDDAGEIVNAETIIQDAVIWLLQHGTMWKSDKIQRLIKYLPVENVEYITDSVVGAQYHINEPTGIFPMCGLDTVVKEMKDCLPVNDIVPGGYFSADETK